MKIIPTEDGSLRIEVDDPVDWQVLQGIAADAVACDKALASRLAELIADEQMAGDWREFVVPDLEDGFAQDVILVAAAVATARAESDGGPGQLQVSSDEAIHWYSALNQARLALEERFRFGPSQDIDPFGLEPPRRSAFFRSQVYCAIQSLLLQHVLR